jgi:deoxyadenosine/deoxycytidine kinase
VTRSERNESPVSDPGGRQPGARYIAVEGPTGVGKTTLGACLRERLGWKLLLDPYEANPFLAQYYRAEPSAEWTPLLVESAFIFLRVAQLRHARDCRESHLISDYMFLRTRIYADLLSDASDAARLKNVLDLWAPDVPSPDTVILLSASTETLMTRIRRRGRAIEEWLTDDHIRRLQRGYRRFGAHLEARVIEVDADNWDPRRKRDLDTVIDALLV